MNGHLMLVSALPTSPTVAAGAALEARIKALFADHFDFVWRSARRLGADAGAADDLAQEAFLVAARRLPDIEPGKEKAFLFGTVLRLIADARRKAARRREVPADETLAGAPASDAGPDARLDQARARAMLDQVIAGLPDDTRPVFVLYELEQMTMAEIAACLDLAPGTVASRLRRAREAFTAAVARTQARAASKAVVR
jgi:RNA polymerase sigma-70 factor (ECF subfamily)